MEGLCKSATAELLLFVGIKIEAMKFYASQNVAHKGDAM